jgi:hypothetical protein
MKEPNSSIAYMRIAYCGQLGCEGLGMHEEGMQGTAKVLALI